ncbi:MAG: hypothetical protein IV097_21830 [Burkholderiaceae bacterium]|nr:hypothetical protein [Burkholderiaceae bacterium]
MNSIRMNEVAARVVAWHNRHPLARRITSAQVGAIGVIALPFVTTAERAGGTVRADLAAPRVVVEPSFGAPPVLDQMVTQDEPAPAAQDAAVAKASLRERAMAAVPGEVSAPGAPAALAEPEVAKAGGWLGALRLPWLRSRAGFEPVFSENFIAPLRPKQVAAWALQHGSTTRPGEPAWPQREVLADAALQTKAAGKPGVEPVTLYLVTAAIDTPTRRLRVLLGRNGTLKLLGPRDWSLVRMLVIGLLLPALVGLAAWFLLQGAQAPAPEAALPAPPASAVAASVPAASAPTLTQHVAEPAASAVVVIAEAVASAPVPQASAPVLAAAAEASASAAAIDKTRSSRTRPQLSDEARQAAMAEGKQMRASDPLPPARTPPPAASAPAPKPSKAPDPGSLAIPATPEADRGPSGAAQRPAQGGSAPATAKFYALVTKPSFSKVDAEARMILLRAGAANAIAPAGTRIELIQARQAWQAVWWPFAKRDDAERARGLLAARGVQVELVEF